jgi:lipopolysaccharide transport system permease protein
MFAWRDLVLRYKQTVVGILWVLLRPLATMAIFVVVFGKFLKVSSGDIPYPLLVLSGLIAWQFFTAVFAGVSESLFSYSAVLSKVYFPRFVVPLSAFVVNAVDALIALLLLIPFMAFYGIAPSWRMLVLPVVFAAATPASLGLGLWFAAVAAKYRDFRNIVPFVTTALLYASPVAFSGDVIPEVWRDVYWLNPLVGVIEGFRWVLFGKASIPPAFGGIASAGISILLLLFGYRYFRRSERSVVDVI